MIKPALVPFVLALVFVTGVALLPLSPILVPLLGVVFAVAVVAASTVLLMQLIKVVALCVLLGYACSRALAAADWLVFWFLHGRRRQFSSNRGSTATTTTSCQQQHDYVVLARLAEGEEEEGHGLACARCRSDNNNNGTVSQCTRCGLVLCPACQTHESASTTTAVPIVRRPLNGDLAALLEAQTHCLLGVDDDDEGDVSELAQRVLELVSSSVLELQCDFTGVRVHRVGMTSEEDDVVTAVPITSRQGGGEQVLITGHVLDVGRQMGLGLLVMDHSEGGAAAAWIDVAGSLPLTTLVTTPASASRNKTLVLLMTESAMVDGDGRVCQRTMMLPQAELDTRRQVIIEVLGIPRRQRRSSIREVIGSRDTALVCLLAASTLVLSVGLWWASSSSSSSRYGQAGGRGGRTRYLS